MDFVFQGFQSALPVWGYILLFLGTTALSWWSYKSIRTIPSFYRYGLISLRSLVFFILLTLLINPFYKAETTYYEKPEILFIMDNSASTAIEKGDYKGLASYQKVLEKLGLDDSSRVNFRFYALDQNVRPVAPDSLSFDGSGTNLFNTYNIIEDHQRNATAAVLISDGIFNQGRDPAFQAGNIDIPLYTIALGDTSQQQDLIVKNVTTNTTGYVNTHHPVEVTVLNNGFAGQPFDVQIKKGDRVIDSRTVVSESERSSHTLNFELEPEEEGLQQYTIFIPPHDGEWTDANNEHLFSVDVLDEKQRILSLAFEIHPDVGMIRSTLLGDENTLLIPRTWLGGNRFVEGPLEIGSDSLDLVILQGYPESGVPETLNEKVTAILGSVPSIVLPSPRSSFPALNQRIDFSLPVQQNGQPNYVPVNLKAAVDPTAHPIMELPQIDFQRMSSVSAPLQNLSLSGRAKTLFTGTFQGTDTNQPLIAIQRIGNLRQAQVTGYGWYRIAQSPNTQDREFIEQLFSNLVSWTATKPDDRMLNVNPSQTVFTIGQPVLLNAFLTNESGESESEAAIEVTISGEVIQKRYYSMNNTGSGQYQLRLNALPEGVYSFEATAQKGNRVIDTRKGEFSVSNSNIEYVNTQRNDLLLQQMAQRSGGMSYIYNQVDRFWKDLEEKGLLTMEQKVRDTLFYPYQHAFWFIIVIAFLAAEWIIRKYLALP